MKTFRNPHFVYITIVSTVLLSGCISPEALKKDYADYSDVYGDSNDKQLLLNLAREANQEPVYFIQLASISSQYQFSTSGGITAGGSRVSPLSAAASTVQRTLSLGGSLSGGFTQTPIFQFVPLTGTNLSQAIFSPIQDNVFYTLYDQNWYADLLARIMIWTVEKPISTTNGTHQIITTNTFACNTTYKTNQEPNIVTNFEVLVNDPTDPSYPKFLEYCDDLREAQTRHLLLIDPSDPGTNVVFGPARAKLPDVISAISNGLHVTSVTNDKVQVTKPNETPKLVERSVPSDQGFIAEYLPYPSTWNIVSNISANLTYPADWSRATVDTTNVTFSTNEQDYYTSILKNYTNWVMDVTNTCRDLPETNLTSVLTNPPITMAPLTNYASLFTNTTALVAKTDTFFSNVVSQTHSIISFLQAHRHRNRRRIAALETNQLYLVATNYVGSFGSEEYRTNLTTLLHLERIISANLSSTNYSGLCSNIWAGQWANRFYIATQILADPTYLEGQLATNRPPIECLADGITDPDAPLGTNAEAYLQALTVVRYHNAEFNIGEIGINASYTPGLATNDWFQATAQQATNLFLNYSNLDNELKAYHAAKRLASEIGHIKLKMRTFEAILYCIANEQRLFDFEYRTKKVNAGITFTNDPYGTMATVTRSDGNPYQVRPILVMRYGDEARSKLTKFLDVSHDGYTYTIGDLDGTNAIYDKIYQNDPYPYQNRTVFTIVSYLFSQTTINSQNLPVQQLIQVQ